MTDEQRRAAADALLRAWLEVFREKKAKGSA